MKTNGTRLRLAAVLAAGLCAGQAWGASGSWTNNTSGNWSVANNWADGAVADGAGFTGWFTNNIAAACTGTIDTTSRSLGVLNIGDADNTHPFVIAATAPVKLAFDNSGANAQLNQVATSHTNTIGATLALVDSLDIANASTNLLTISGVITGAASNVRTLSNKGSGSGGVVISGAISNGAGTVAVVQNSGASRLTLSGANAYAGGTTIAAGKLRVANTAGSATGPGAVNINNGGTLLGSGTISGTVTNNHEGTLSPGLDGTAGGTLTVGNLAWNGGGVFKCEIASISNNEAGAGVDYDQVVVSGALTAAPGGSNLVIRMDSLGQTLAFEANRNYSLKVITCGTAATLSPADVTLDTNAFLAGGTWAVTNLNKSIYVICQGSTSPNKNYWRGTGNWSTATNWSLGHAPVPGEDVEFDFQGIANCTADIVSNDLGSVTVAAGYPGTITFQTKYPEQGTYTNVTIAGNCTIKGGTLTHTANAGSETYRLAMTVGSNLTIGGSGTINVDGAGYGGSQGPGKPVTGGGAGYGGIGGRRSVDTTTIPGSTYGSVTTPTNCGSGGNTSGGGAIILTVRGTTTLDGFLSANGNGGTMFEGSGGSVFLQTANLAGSGTIQANGGGGGFGPGGGGRVAVILTNDTDFGSVRLTAFTGTGQGPAAGGTVYLERKGDLPGQGKLIVDYNDAIPAFPAVTFTLQNGAGFSSNAFSEIILTNGGIYALGTNNILDITAAEVRGDPSDRNDGIFVIGGTLTVPGTFAFSNYFIGISAADSTFSPTSLTVGANATWRLNVPWVANYPVTVDPGGMMDHSANGSAETYRLNLAVNGDLNIKAGGQINVDGMGYAGNQGPGKPGFGGAGYGGIGGKRSQDVGSPGTTYGSITAPTNCGSGSNSSGGGAIILAVSGTATLDGFLSANGMGSSSYCGGSGGSVYLRTAHLSGSGTIQANGASMGWGQGGGGRVAVILTNDTDFGSVRMTAFTGTGQGEAAGGTVYLEQKGDLPGKGKLIVDYNDTIPAHPTTAFTLQNGTVASSHAFSEIILTNGGVYALGTNNALDITAAAVKGDPSDRNDGIFLIGGTLTIPAAFAFTNYFIGINAVDSTFSPTSLSVGPNATWRLNVPWVANYPVTVEPGGVMDHSANGSAEINKMKLTINGSLDIQAGGQINVDGMGYTGNQGPGKPVNGGGAGYGGIGGRRSGDTTTIPGLTYGSITAPTNLGSGANSSGGGAVLLAVDGSITLNGVISANAGASSMPCGSGGSVYLRTGHLAGSGTIRANASNGGWGPGGGGRVAVILTNDTGFGDVRMQALTGTGDGAGAGGTVYTEHAGQLPGHGLLQVDWNNLIPVSGIFTMIGTTVTDTAVGTVIITNSAILAISNQVLTVRGNWVNKAVFLALTNSTVNFAGSSAATIMTNNTFFNLTCTNAGKTLYFEAGRTNVVNGLLKLGAPGLDPLVTLRSTADGFWSYLTLATGGTQQLGRLNVKDNNAGNGQPLTAGRGSVSDGNTVNWLFPKMGGTVIMVW